MKIKLAIDENGLIRRTFSVKFKRFHIRKPIEFIIDTGSNSNFISESDALKIDIPINKIKFKREIHGLTGGKLSANLGDGYAYVLDDEEKARKLHIKDMSMIRTKGETEKERKESLKNPSILGVNFLKENNLKLVYKPSENIAYLEF